MKFFLFLTLCLFNLFTNANAKTAVSPYGMVVSEHELASLAGASILNAGGNAFDAAVAVGYALAVVNPCCGNIGGGGFALLHFADGKNTFLNFRERAPLKATKSMFYKEGALASTEGYLAVAVPGTVLGLETLLKKYGTLSRSLVMQPAIQLAEKGFIVSPYLAKQFAPYKSTFKQQANIASIFLRDGKTYQAGDRLIQTDLARTLQLIAKEGADVFYQGSIAKEVVQASQAHGGILSLADFSQYHVEELTPIECHYRGYTLISAPPPSSGGITLCEMLNILENFPLYEYPHASAKSKRIIIEAMRYGFIDRNKLGDPRFVSNPTSTLLSKAYAKSISETIKASRLSPPVTTITPIPDLTDTTHFSVMDRFGNAVSLTYTLNGFFGAEVIAKHTGFFLNNEMDDFTTKEGAANKFGLVQSDTNDIEPGKRPLSSMTPTLILKNNKIFLVIGSPGGPRIITAVLLTILNVIDYDKTLAEAIDSPRFHYQVHPNFVSTEPFAFSFSTRKQLEQWGYHLFSDGTWSAVEAIYVDPSTKLMTGVNDKRRPDGSAAPATS